MENLKDFMLIFRMEIQANYQPNAEEISKMKKSWGNWIGGIAQNARLVSSYQVGFDGATIGQSRTPNSGFHIAEKNSVSGNLVLKAKDLNEAAEIAKDCPIIDAGGEVEVRNVLTVY